MGRDKVSPEELFFRLMLVVNIFTCRSAPISNITFPTSTETITAIRFNLSESSVLASIGSDRTFTLYDIRTGKAERRVIMQVRSHDPYVAILIYLSTRCVAMLYRGHPLFRPPFYLRLKITIFTRSILDTSRRQPKYTKHMLRL